MSLSLRKTNKSLVLLLVPLLGVLLAAACSSATPGKNGAAGNGGGGTPSNPLCPEGICISTPECPGGICVPDTGADCEGEKKIIIAGAPRLGPIASGAARFERAEPVPEECQETVSWVPPEETPETPEVPPPAQETFECPPGMIRVHVRDIWSTLASPTRGDFTERPAAVYLEDTGQLIAAGTKYTARQESAGCDWYSTCIPPALTQFGLNAAGPGTCPSTQIVSGNFDISGLAGASEIWIDYTGSNLQADYGYYGQAAPRPGFRVTSNRADVEAVLCPAGMPDTTTPAGFTKLHIRWPWADPTVTSYPGTACEDDKAGLTTPPYPTSLGVEFTACPGAQATLEFQNGHCPWYSLLVPNEWWPEAGGDRITLRYVGPTMDQTLYSAALTLPARTADEYWLGYIGAPDDVGDFGTPCNNFSNRANAYAFFTSNPGPGYSGCGGDGDVQVDPCSPPVPDGYSTVHFRYLWAGQKIFTYFPNKDLMPPWMVLEVNGGGGDKDVICFREADRPWFNCPVPNSEFYPGATWRAVDKTHNPEWNTVETKPFAETPAEWWLRWYYGKPDIPATARYKFYDYYPDATNGDWSATTDWNDEACAPKPPASGPPALGFEGWFPYDETNYAYGFGTSLARTFERSAEVQDLLNAFVQERYLLWKENYVVEDAGCGARVARPDSSMDTVSEGQGYGMAITAAIGDRATFDELWTFARHYLSQSAKKYCGGLMGWMWKPDYGCGPLDTPCDIEVSTCSGDADSAFDGDVDIAIGLVFAAMQWPEYRQAAVGWLTKMECEVNSLYDGTWNYPAPGDTFNKNCQDYPNGPCTYTPGVDGDVNMSYYPPGYFRVFGDFLARYASDGAGETHRQFWYKTAATVYELYERGYDNPAVHPGLTTDWGSYTAPNSRGSDNYNWSRALWRVGVDAAWFGHRTDIPENIPGSSQHYPAKSRVQAKIDNIQDYYSNFYLDNPVEPNANRFSTLCNAVVPAGTAAGCDPAYDHNSYFVNTAMTAFANVFDNEGQTTADIRREALEEAVSATVMNDRYYQESIGVYTMLFLTGNFPNPLEVP